jgi:hypothetical protein
VTFRRKGGFRVRGLRHGEAVGLRDADVDLEHGDVVISQQITTVGWTPVTKKVNAMPGTAPSSWTTAPARPYGPTGPAAPAGN